MWIGLGLLLLGLVAGSLGALLGLGGGIFLVPALSLLFGLPMRTAVGTSLICVIATSAGVASVSRAGRSADYGLALRLELVASAAALSSSLVAGWLSSQMLAILFAAMVFAAAYFTYRKTRRPASASATAVEALFQIGYTPRNWPVALAMTGLAGALSGLTGSGGGFIKAPVMYSIMDVPLGIATATSNFMVGITAAASALVYLGRGDIYPQVAVPTALGVFIGAVTGARIATRVRVTTLRQVLIILLLLIGVQMLWKGIGGG